MPAQPCGGHLETLFVRYFEDFEAGHCGEVRDPYLVTEEEIIEFGRRFDHQPFHLDPEAAKASIFGGLVCSSVHLLAISVALSQRADDTPAAAVSALGFEGMKLHAPARPGDALWARLRVRNVRLSRSRPDCGIVENGTEVLNQQGELIFSYSNAFLVKRRPAKGS